MRTFLVAASLFTTVLVTLGAAVVPDATGGPTGDATDATGAALAFPAAHGPPAFGPAVTLEPRFWGGEPNVVVDGDGRIYVAAVGRPSGVWRSDDGGATFARMADIPGDSGDSDIVVDDDGTVYVSDLFTEIPVSASHDHGATWAYTTQASASPEFEDRQWMAADGSGTVYVIWRDFNRVYFSVSHDAARTWAVQDLLLTGGSTLTGPPVIGPDGALNIPLARGEQVDLLRSEDGGATWSRTPVATRPGMDTTSIFPVAALDDAGNLYVTWSERVATASAVGAGSDPRVMLTVSTDDGATFSAPVQVSDGAHLAVLPWVVAGAEGRVALFWLDGVPLVPVGLDDPDRAPEVEWYVRSAFSTDAHKPSPTFSTALVTPDVVHTGSTCIHCNVNAPGLIVPGVANDRRMLDFFEADIDLDGRAVVSWTQDVPIEPGDVATLRHDHTISLHFAKQVGGPRLR